MRGLRLLHWPLLLLLALLVSSCGAPAGTGPRYQSFAQGELSLEYPAWPAETPADAGTLVAVTQGPLGVWLKAYPGDPQDAQQLSRDFVRTLPGGKLLAANGPEDTHPWLEFEDLQGGLTIHTRVDFYACNGQTYALTTAAARNGWAEMQPVFAHVRASLHCGQRLLLPQPPTGRVGMAITPADTSPAAAAAPLNSPTPGTPAADNGTPVPTPTLAIGAIPDRLQLAAQQAAAIGVQVAQLTFHWGDIEQRDGSYDWSVPDYQIKTCRNEGLIVSALLALTEHGVRGRLPQDLQAASWSDPALQARLARFLQAFAIRYADQVRYLELGNEVDLYLAAHPDETAGWLACYAAGAGAVRAGPVKTLLVGSVLSFGDAERNGLLGLTAQLEPADFVAYSAFLCDAGRRFSGTPPADVGPWLDRMLAGAGGKPVLITATGWSSDPADGGSESAQAAYARALLQALSARRDRFAFVAWANEHDSTLCTRLAAQTIDPAAWQPFLCSLGLRTSEGTAKPGWNALERGLRDYLARQ